MDKDRWSVPIIYWGNDTYEDPVSGAIIRRGVWARREGLWEVYKNKSPVGFKVPPLQVEVRHLHQIISSDGVHWFAEEILT